MDKDDFITHACEQVIRFSSVAKWDDLSEERKVQLGFNLGVAALGLGLSKNDGYMSLANAREGLISMDELNKHLRAVIASHKINIDEKKIARHFN